MPELLIEVDEPYLQFIEEKAIPSLGIETKKTIFETIAQAWLNQLD